MSYHHNPYDTSPYNAYEDYDEEGSHGQNSPAVIPMNLMRSHYDVEPRALAFETPSSHQYGHAHINPSFDYEPEASYTLPNFVDAPSNPYGRRSSDTPDREEDLIRNLAAMSARERVKAVQKLPKTMKEKREIRNYLLLSAQQENEKSRWRSARMNCCTQCFYSTALTFRQFKNGLWECLQLLQFWQKTLKEIGGNFGTGVRSYFVFLTWLLAFNFFSFLVNFSFLTIPQLIAAVPNNLSFIGLEFFTGTGYFDDTVLYYGSYTNSTVRLDEGSAPYYMQLAYIFTLGLYFVICFLSLLYSMAKSFRKNFINPRLSSGHAAKLLCVWDFSITDEKAVRVKQRNLSTQIKETLSEVTTEALKLSLCQKIGQLSIHLTAWVFSSGVAVASCAGIYFFSRHNLERFLRGDKNRLENQAATLLLPVVVGLLNHVVPFFYSFFGFMEKFTYPKHQIYTTILRNVILKMSIVGILCYYWLDVVTKSESECWETIVGQDIYRLLVAEFFCCLLGSFFGEFVRRLLGTKCCQKLGVPEFDIARNVLDLIYAQTLTWIGIFFSPLLPLIQMISFLIIFYVKKVSLMLNCQPPQKAWRASQMNTVFIFLLFFPSFAGVLSVIAVTVWRLKPSETCGPFRGLPTIYEAISDWIAVLTSYPGSVWVVWIYHNLIESVHFFFILSVLVLIITYLYWQIIDGRKIMVKLLQEQIINEGKDKMFLLKKLRALQASKRPNRGDQPESAGIPEMSTFSPAAQKDHHNNGSAMLSDVLALALRARQEAEWEMEDEEFST
ncbi:transmembrane channel-like protein 5 [Tiliqua scincoides]|uniref:transmembrane channel-like protein 5 n=1 Tax=Tiliqua scincoides TaxID=71010 RepID=UPI0034624B17